MKVIIKEIEKINKNEIIKLKLGIIENEYIGNGVYK